VTRRLICVALVLALAGANCGSGGDEGGGPRIVVGSKLDTEAQLLGHLLASTLAAKGYRVERKIPLGNTELTRKALQSRRIDVYWEFTGSALSLLRQAPVGDPQQAYERARALDAGNGITWLPAARMNDTYALAVAGGEGPLRAQSLTELAGYVGSKPATKLCVDPEGGFREDVLPRLDEVYGLEFAQVQQIGYELVPPAVASGQCQVGIVYSTAALISKHGLRVLADDKQAFGAYTPAPTVRTDRLKRWPDLTADLAALTAALDTPTVTRLNARVDVDRVPVRKVAEEFLSERGIVGPSR
jgi:osmoprotectant transport system substrate-binding protein